MAAAWGEKKIYETIIEKEFDCDVIAKWRDKRERKARKMRLLEGYRFMSNFAFCSLKQSQESF